MTVKRRLVPVAVIAAFQALHLLSPPLLLLVEAFLATSNRRSSTTRILTRHPPQKSPLPHPQSLVAGGASSDPRSSRRFLLPYRDADLVEQWVGGVRYSLIPLPHDLVSTTLYVSNLDEFVHDDDLSQLFHGNPACVVRKPDLTSLRYGFVAFRTTEEAEMALIKTCGVTWRGKTLDVQPIRRDGVVVRVPEKLVAYVKGAKAVHRILQDSKQPSSSRQSSSTTSSLSHAKKAKQSKQRSNPTSTSSSTSSRQVLNLVQSLKSSDDRAEWDRAQRRGFLVVLASSSSYRQRQQKLIDAHRQYCCHMLGGKPQIVVVKGHGSRTLDRVLIDLSPLRLQGIFTDSHDDDDDDVLIQWKVDILQAAHRHGVRLRDDDSSESCQVASRLEQHDDAVGERMVAPLDDWTCAYTVTIDEAYMETWVGRPITAMPPLSLGIFEGERPQAKAMAKELAELWDLPDPVIQEQRVQVRRQQQEHQHYHNTHGKKGKAPRRNRGGGHHQAYW